MRSSAWRIQMRQSLRFLPLLLVFTLTTCAQQFSYNNVTEDYQLADADTVTTVDGTSELLTDLADLPEEGVTDLVTEEVCIPDCDGKDCGDDGCGGTCGECPANATCDEEGQCPCDFVPCGESCCADGALCFEDACCTVDCEGKDCGDDACGGSCGECADNASCGEAGSCGCDFEICGGGCCPDGDVCFEDACCTPQCGDSTCGDDGCGGQCGSCEEGYDCTDADSVFSCVANCVTLCQDLECGTVGLEDECDCGTCGDETICTDDGCEEGACVFTNNEIECDDGNPCTDGDICAEGVCAGILKPLDELTIEECICAVNEDCADLENGNLCDGTLVCHMAAEEDEEGLCMIDPATVITSCDDSIPCTSEECVPADGCVYTTNHDQCDDSNLCTDNVCDLELNCTFPANELPCDDANACTTEDSCSEKACVGGPALECIDNVGCTDDTCEPETGCVYTPNHDLCDDLDVCTDNVCDLAQDCTYPFNTAECDDSVLCTVDDICAEGTCAGTPKVCADDLWCNGEETCEVETGNCLDGDAPVIDDTLTCTIDSCDEEKDQVINEPDHSLCEDDNQCTEDVCDPVDGCLHPFLNMEPCEDGDECTLDDVCKEDTCISGPMSPACLDWDHDGLLNPDDSCPLAFDPQQLDLDMDAQWDACVTAPGGYPFSRALNLTVGDSTPTTRRTHEPMEFPLMNGFVDRSIVGILRFDGDVSMDSIKDDDFNAVLVGAIPTTGAFGDPGGALSFDGEDDHVIFPFAMFGNTGTICMWARSSQSGTTGSGLTDADGGGAAFTWNFDDLQMRFRLGTETGKVLEAYSDELPGMNDGNWHHYCWKWSTQEDKVGFYYDAQAPQTFYVTTGTPDTDDFLLMEWPFGAIKNENGELENFFAGDVDEMIVASRPLAESEIALYYNSKKPYGTNYLPGTQEDYDDVMVTEISATPGALEVMKRARLIGPRVHSDTPCPDGAPDETFADRDDLCGVAGYWRLDDNPTDVTGKFHGEHHGGEGDIGRFGRDKHSMRFHDQDYLELPQVFTGQLDEFTMEAWFMANPNAFPGGDDFTPGFQRIFVQHGNYNDYSIRLSYSPLYGDDFSLQCETGGNGTDWGMGTSVKVAVDEFGGGSWHHFGCTFDHGVARIYLDGRQIAENGDNGSMGPTANADLAYGATRIGRSTYDVDQSFNGVIDEVITHTVAKSADYFYHRANPGIPTIRFLANTTTENMGSMDEPLYPFVDYRIYWGKEDTEMHAPVISSALDAPDDIPATCYGLLNPCLGYAGWWRFENDGGDRATDSSTGKNNGKIPNFGGWTDGLEGNALAMDGAGVYVHVDHDDLFDLDSMTLESLAMIDSVDTGMDKVLVSKGLKNGPGYYNFALFDSIAGELSFQFENQAGDDFSLQKSDAIPDNSFAAYAVTYDLSEILLLVDGDIVAKGVSLELPAHTDAPLTLGADQLDDGSPTSYLSGALDSTRVMNRALLTDEMLHYPLADVVWGGFDNGLGNPLDSDNDGIPDDGDGSGIVGDNPCPDMVTEDCDDNATFLPNEDQADGDNDGIGTVADNCPDLYNPDQTDDNANNIGDLCDPAYKTDWDHDGLIGDDDSCPFAYDPYPLNLDNGEDPDACEENHYGYQHFFTLNGYFGASTPTTRRTNEVVEIPLMNGLLDDSLLGYWKFDDNGNDSSGNDHHGTPVGGEFYGGYLAGAIALDGDKDRVELDGTIMNGLHEYTVAMWIKPVTIMDADSPRTDFWYRWDNSGDSTCSISYKDGAFNIHHKNAPDMITQFYPASIPADEWHHITYAKSSDNELRLYIDGILQAPSEIYMEGNPAPKLPDGTQMHLGQRPDGEHNFHGSIDDVLIFNRELSPDEVAVYVHSRAPYGTRLTEHAQADFDDVRVQEQPLPGEAGEEYLKRSRIVGPRPHSDTMCPEEYGDMATQDIPAIEHREDMCGVLAYWKLDGNANDVTNQFDGTSVNNPAKVKGRFGDDEGAMSFTGGKGINLPKVLSGDYTEITMEAWVTKDTTDSAMIFLHNAEKAGMGMWSGYDQQQGLMSLVCRMGGTGIWWDDIYLQWPEEPQEHLNKWYHLACVLDHGMIRGYVNGQLVKETPHLHLHEGEVWNAETNYIETTIGMGYGYTSYPGKVDELILHKVAKSSDYIYNRANPGVPKIRFLANTGTVNDGTDENPLYQVRGYELMAGNTQVKMSTPFISSPDPDKKPCYGLLNDCLGYRGWWRLEHQPHPAVNSAIDATLGKVNGDFGDGLDWTADSWNGLGLAFDGTGGFVKIKDNPLLHVDEGTMEAVFSPGLDIDGQIPSTLPLFNKDDNGHQDDYLAAFTTGGYVQYYRETDIGQKAIFSNSNQWSAEEDYHMVFFAGPDGMQTSVNGEIQAQDEGLPGGFGGGNASLYLGANVEFDQNFNGTLSQFRLMSRTLEPDEYLQPPVTWDLHWPDSAPPLGDSDYDGIFEDGDGSGIEGDNPCTGGQTINCDDNAPGFWNPEQADEDADGIGTGLDNCPDLFNPDQDDHYGNGVGDLCDLFYTTDWDHDGLVGGDDPCPLAFDVQPLDQDNNGQSDACESKPVGWTKGIVGSFAGITSTRQLTNRPVEVPLANGILDSSVLAYYTLNGNANDSSGNGKNGTVNGATASEGAFSDAGGSMFFGDQNSISLPQVLKGDLAQFTVAAWFRIDGSGGALHRIFMHDASANNVQLSYINDGGNLRVQVAAGMASNGDPHWFHVDTGIAFTSIYGKWQHMAMTYDYSDVVVYLNGNILGQTSGMNTPDGILKADTNYQNTWLGDSPYESAMNGVVDEFIAWNRALTPDELATYIRSAAPYASRLLPDAQADFDDVRVIEQPGMGEPWGEYVTRSRIIGPRVHSDTSCPAQYDGQDVTTIPGIEHREDLCGVQAYWRLDGDGNDVTGHHTATNNGANSNLGRFGDSYSGMAFNGSAYLLPDSPFPISEDHSFTVETWFSCPPDGGGDIFSAQDAGEIRMVVNPDVISFAVGSSDEANDTVKSEIGVCDGTWHHITGVRNASDKTIALYLDGQKLMEGSNDNLGSLNPDGLIPVIGARQHPDTVDNHFIGILDDFVVHRVAKSPDYIYNRANPGVPKIRFLANTNLVNMGSEEAPLYPVRDYSFRFGNSELTMAPPFVSGPGDKPCYGLVNECLGYAGWWRFNEGDGTVATDTTTAKRNGKIVGTTAWQQAVEGTALQFDGDTTYVEVAHDDGLNLNHMTLEASTKFTTIGGADTVIVKGTYGDADGMNFRLAVDDADEMLKSGYTYGPDKSPWHPTAANVLKYNEWHVYGVGIDDTLARFFRDGIELDNAEIPALPNTTPSSLIFGAYVIDANPIDMLKDPIDQVRIMNRALAPDELLTVQPMTWILPWPGTLLGDGTCGGIKCPQLNGYEISCNEQHKCEYTNWDQEGHHKWDVWIYVPPGSFDMGGPAEEGGTDAERPIHTVSFKTGYFISKYEIVVEQYESCLSDEGKCSAPSTETWDGEGWGVNSSFNGRSSHPQNGITWQQSQDFCGWVVSGGRLPSAAEWEYAASGPMHRKYPWGDGPEPSCSNNTAVFNEAGGTDGYGCGAGGTLPVGSQTAGTAWSGALDMSGNLWEWVADYYHDSYDGAPTDGSAWVKPTHSMRVRRGGGFNHPATHLRAAENNANPPGYMDASHGARCVRPVPPQPETGCGSGPPCPDLDGYKVSCNEQSTCEYTGPDQDGYKKWDVWIYVPAGGFQMGGPAEEGGSDNERPVHEVTLNDGYLIAKYPVTTEQYEACMADNPGKCTAPSTADYDATGWGPNTSANGRADHPQNGLTWNQSVDYCAWSALGARLSTEAEWEYAASGPVHRKYPWGDSPEPTCSNNTAVFNESGEESGWGCGVTGTWPVDSMPGGVAWSGAMDMAGNLWEWNMDRFHDNYNNAPTDGTAWEIAGSERTVRGGSFGQKDLGIRTAYRGAVDASMRSAGLGARCVRPLPAPADGCGGIVCPPMDGHTPICNKQDKCEYYPNDISGHNKWDIWIYIPPGSFEMGSPDDEEDGTDYEKPFHQVTFDYGYFISKYEIVVEQYEACLAENPDECTAPVIEPGYDGDGWGLNSSANGRNNHPQNALSWVEIDAYCSWSIPGGRAPSEAEWEYAATGPVHHKYVWGDSPEPSCEHTVFNADGGVAGNGCETGGTFPVGSKPSGTAWSGALDMSGNLGEWTEDQAHLSYNGAPADGSAWMDNPDQPGNRVTRGSDFMSPDEYQRAAGRGFAPFHFRLAHVGGRCVVKVDNSDGDNVPDADDNCPYIANPNQADSDSDGHGDLCDGMGTALPASCKDIKEAGGDATDGNYWIYPQGIAVDVYCKNMATTPKTYLNLPKIGGTNNYSSDQVTFAWYTRVAFDPETLAIDVTDRTFNYNLGPNLWGGETLDYAFAESCSPTVYGNVELTSTALAVIPDQFIVDGWEPTGASYYSSHNQVVDFEVAGGCGSIYPKNKPDLNLEFLDGLNCDWDGDGIMLADDNCPNLANADQADDDGDGLGEACEPTCSGVKCPAMVGHLPACNSKGMCEYKPNDATGHKRWDEWIYIPPGSFEMGSPVDEVGGTDFEKPLHQVTFDHGYFISKYEVVVQQYEACMAENPDGCAAPAISYSYDGDGWGLNSSANNRADHPQNGISWVDMGEYCAWATPGGRVPSEAEWEYAAKGPEHRKYVWGDSPDPTCDYAVYNAAGGKAGNGCGTGGTFPVGSKPAGMAWSGALDMSGNLFEWVDDNYHDNYQDAPTDGSAWLDNPDQQTRALHGSSFMDAATMQRAAQRTSAPWTWDMAHAGGRCVKPVPAPEDGCGGMECPDLPGYVATCNTSDKCEYLPLDRSDHRRWDIWIYVPPGTFTMGSPDAENNDNANEQPQHQVTISTGYFISKYEAVVEQYEACNEAFPNLCTAASADNYDCDGWGVNSSDNVRNVHPQNGLNFHQAKAFCQWSAPGGRLPAEAEWEYAATGPEHRKYPWGDLPNANCSENNAVISSGGLGCGTGGTWAVGSKAAGAAWSGALDMSGNLWEWVADEYHDTYDGAPDNGSVWSLDQGLNHVIKGGSFVDGVTAMRTSIRIGDNQDWWQLGNLGARCVRPLPQNKCGGTECPSMDGYATTCNQQNKCEYHPLDDSGHKKWNVWIYVPPGSFEMGSEGEGGVDEVPVHEVTIDYGYLMSKYEVVVEQYEACMAANPGQCTPADTIDWGGLLGTNTSANAKSEHPQNGLTWQQSKDFCAWIAPAGRLPSEAEWEYAATGPIHMKYPWGNSPEASCEGIAVFDEEGAQSGWGCGQGGTWSVGSKPAGASWSGALDMSGNVWEWSEDWYHDSFAGAPVDGSASTVVGIGRVIRGGSFSVEAVTVRSSERSVSYPSDRSAHLGARCAATVLNSDGDTIPDVDDNCPFLANPDQADSDGDGQGDLCDGLGVPLPASCADIKDSHPEAGDGDYFIFPQGVAVDVFCKDMDDEPTAYLRLNKTGGDFNFATDGTYDKQMKTNYTKVAFDPEVLAIKYKGHHTYAYSDGFDMWGKAFISYACAAACSMPAEGSGNVDLTGTFLKVLPDQFEHSGWASWGGSNYLSNNQVVDIWGGGGCGGIGPSDPDYLFLDIVDGASGDWDGDGVLWADDNCPNLANADQADADGNGLGDACE
jgi:formylglycine-generating enzyme required for sulfatase activity